MSDFTYETKCTKGLETYEWDNVWWEHANDPEGKRVLIIGDSISCGYRRMVTEKSGIYCDGLGTSKSVDNPFFIDTIKLFMAQQPRCDGILFNNGLHGWHLSDESYGENMGKVLNWLLTLKIPVILALTTPVRGNQDRNDEVIKRNKVATLLADELHIPTIDLYSLLENKPELTCPDGVHLIADGYDLVAEKCSEMIKSYL